MTKDKVKNVLSTQISTSINETEDTVRERESCPRIFLALGLTVKSMGFGASEMMGAGAMGVQPICEEVSDGETG